MDGDPLGLSWLYHLFCMTYKWTMPELDEVEMPMIFCLIDQIGETPPHDFLANAQMKAAQRKAMQDQKSALGQIGVTKGKVRRKKDGN